MRYPNFDILRLLLASEVVFAHSWWAVDNKFQWFAFVMAVPAFLAISGFLVLQSYEQTGSWQLFIRKRILRIVPALLASLLLCLALFDWHMVLNSILNWLTGGVYTLPGRANGPLWSLAWEELAYAVLALLWMAGAYRRPVLIWALLATSLVLNLVISDVPPPIRIIMFLPPAFFVGNLMYLHRKTVLKVNGILPWVTLFAVIWWRGTIDVHAGELVLLMLQAFSVVWAGMAGSTLVPFRFPDLSYSIYIFHMPLLYWIQYNWHVKGLPEMLLMLSGLLWPICLVSWYFVEKPALSFKNRPFPQLSLKILAGSRL